jgi:hypothetical protein
MSFVYYKESGNGTCIKANVAHSPAKSPAFLLETYDSTEYSTWTESRYGLGLRIDKMRRRHDIVQLKSRQYISSESGVFLPFNIFLF